MMKTISRGMSKVNVFRKWMTLILSLVTLGLAGCGDGDKFYGDTAGAVVDPTGNYTIAVSAQTPSIIVGSTTQIVAQLVDENQIEVSGAVVTFVVDNGAFTGNLKSTTATTDASGRAIVTLTAPIKVGSGTVSAQYSDQSATISTTYLVGPAANIIVDAAPSSVGISSQSTITALVVDQYFNPLPDEPMQFTVTATGSGSPTMELGGVATTNSSGIATATYTSGTTAPALDTVTVAQYLNPTVSGTKDITVLQSATVISNLTLRLSSASTAITVGDSTVTADATVLDTDGQGIAGILVSFQIVGTGDFGGVKSITVPTDTNGIASTTLSAPILVGSASITAATAGLTSNVSVTYIPDVPAAVTLSATPATVGVSTDSTLLASLFDQYGNVTPNEPVTFSFVSNVSGAVLSNPTGNAQTNVNGVATMTYTSGVVLGTDSVKAEAVNGTSVPKPNATTNIAVSASATSISSLDLALSSPSTSITVGTNIVTVDATVTDQVGGPVDGVVVAFEIVGGGDFSGSKLATAVTLGGVASVTLNAPDLVGAATISAATAGLSSNLNVNYIPDVPAFVTISATPAIVGVSTASTLSAAAYDQYGNVTPNEPVTFTITTNNSGGALSNPTGNAQTNASGIATMVYTSGTTVGVSDTIQADAANGTAVPVSTSIQVSTAATIISNLNLALDIPSTAISVGDNTVSIVATVLDSLGGAVAGVPVAFEILGDGDFSGVKLVTQSTDAAGVASVLINAPLSVGSATLRATAAGLSSSLLVTYVPGVPNSVVLSSNVSVTDVVADVILTATVYDAQGNVTPNEPVVFSVAANNSGSTLSNPTGNAQTDAAGKATMTYTSGIIAAVTDTVAVAVTNGTSPTDTLDVAVVSGTATVPTSITIGTDATTINSDGSTVATITATVLDSVNVVVPGVTVSFSADGGVLSAGSVVTDASGVAQVTLSAGTDPTNQTINVTAVTVGVTSVSVPVEVVGSTLSMSATRSNLVIGGTDTATLTITAADAGMLGVFGETIILSVDGASTGTANLAATSGTTNTLGQLSVGITGISTGLVRIIASGLGTSATFDFTVENVSGSLLITSPASGDTAAVNTATTFSIDVPSGTTDVTLVSSLGLWSSSGTNVATWSGLAAPVTITDDLTAAMIGVATVNVSDTFNTAITDNLQLIIVDRTVDADSTVSLQATPTTVAQTIGTTQNSSSLEATVLNSVTSTPIAGARVTFSISNAPGSGEYIDPPVAYTDSFGVARAAFYSGSQSSDVAGLTVTAELDQALTGALQSDSVNIIVGGTAGAIAIGTSTTISSINSNTAYKLPISFQVTDSSGSPVPNTAISLSLWPEKYVLGYWDCETLVSDTILVNEDSNKNLVLDAGEDRSEDGTLTPPISAAGSLPASVSTDDSGIATVDLIYLKDYAGFIYNALTATALVSGTETQATLRFQLYPLKSDVTGCLLGESPLNSHWPVLAVTPELNDLPVTTPGTDLWVTLADSTGLGIVGVDVTATFLSTGTGGATLPTIGGVPDAAPATLATGADGQVTFAYVKGDVPGEDIIKFTYTTPTGVVIARYVTMSAL